jgi:branched-subunit amino acid aminotransferase/4-amino-4-deoxychorismate lyase
MFGAGTAVAVSPVGRIIYRDQDQDKLEELEIPTMTSGANVMQRFYETIVDIQYGRTDRPEWVRIVE